MNYQEHMYDHRVKIPHYKSKSQINSNKHNSSNLSINDNQPRKITNTRERKNNKTLLLSMRAQVITNHSQKQKRISYLSHENYQGGD